MTSQEQEQEQAEADPVPATTTPTHKGIAGRINYAQWDKVATDLIDQTDTENAAEEAQAAELLGLNGKYARSASEAEERVKAQQVEQVKTTLESYQQREAAVKMELTQLFSSTENTANETKTNQSSVRRITRQDMNAGTRVLSITDTHGVSVSHSTLVLTHDLSHLESRMNNANTTNPMAKSYPGDAENDVPLQQQQQQPQSVFGLIKVFLDNLSNCTVLIKCKIISGVVELHNCHNVCLQIQGPHATVATIQADLSNDLTLEFHDAPSGKNPPSTSNNNNTPTLFWGDDPDDRIFHAGVHNLTVQLWRDGMVESQTTADYIKDGAVAVGNATPEEQQFVTSVVDGQLLTEQVLRTGSTTGQQVRAMTEREMQASQLKREKAAQMALAMAEDMMQIKDKDGNPIVTKTHTEPVSENNTRQQQEQQEEQEQSSSSLYASSSASASNNNTNTTTTNDDAEVEEVITANVQAIVDECQQNKARGNEAFGAGEYGQAILLYSLALDKAAELPKTTTDNTLFPTDIVYSNRAACFLKLGQHEKAEADAAQALQINPDNIKALFRQGLALHAMKDYQQALPLLARAHKREPTNKQVAQALKFCEVRLEQEHRQRMMAGM